MNKPEYTLEFLEKTFSKHSENNQKQRRIYREKHGEPSYDDSFDLSAALLTIVSKIRELSDET